MGDNDAFAHAGAYPYDPAFESFAMRDGRPVAAPRAWTRDGPVGWPAMTPTLAVGSNGAVARLSRKFEGRVGALAAAPALVRGGVAVYAGHVTSYGAIAATLAPAPDARALLTVLWLDEASLAHMHETESLGRNYAFRRLEGVRAEALELDLAPFDAPWAYDALTGFFRASGAAPARLAELGGVGVAWPRLTQRAVLRIAARRHGEGLSAPAFVARLVADAGYRRAVNAAMQEDALRPPARAR